MAVDNFMLYAAGKSINNSSLTMPNHRLCALRLLNSEGGNAYEYQNSLYDLTHLCQISFEICQTTLGNDVPLFRTNLKIYHTHLCISTIISIKNIYTTPPGCVVLCGHELCASGPWGQAVNQKPYGAQKGVMSVCH